jgi:hypothetical protein
MQRPKIVDGAARKNIRYLIDNAEDSEYSPTPTLASSLTSLGSQAHVSRSFVHQLPYACSEYKARSSECDVRREIFL